MTKPAGSRKGAGAVSLKPRRSRSVRVDITLAPELLSVLNAYCNSLNATRSGVVALAVTEYLASRCDPSNGEPLPPLVL